MSIEKLIGDLIDAVKENTEAQKAVAAAASSEKPAAKTSAAKKPTAAEKKAATEAAAKEMMEEDKAAAAEKPAAKKPAAKKTTAAKKGTIADLVAAAKGYLNGTDDEDELDVRRANVAAMSAHFGIEKISAMPEDNIAEALGHFKSLEETGTASFMDEAGAEEEDDLV